VTDDLRSRLDQAMAEFETQRQALVKARERVAAVEVTARSRDGVVEATVGADGTPTALRFPGNRHKEMSGQELAASVLEVIRVAREEVAVRVRAGFDEAVGVVRGATADPAEDRIQGLGLDRLLDPLRAPGGPLDPSGGTPRG
jgi:hypothetical protein